MSHCPQRSPLSSSLVQSYYPDGNDPVDAFAESTTWGLDRGFKDLDIGKNDDRNALSGGSPTTPRDHLDHVLDDDSDMYIQEFGFGVLAKDMGFEKGGYYANPVPVAIPCSLEPLPEMLIQNPMNLLYFAHFINHTVSHWSTIFPMFPQSL